MARITRRLQSSGIGWVLLGVAARAIGQWAIIWLLVRVDGPEGVGSYGLVQAWVVPLTTLLNFQLFRYQSTDANSDFSLSDYLVYRLLGCLAAYVVTGIFTWFLPDDLRFLVFSLTTQLLAYSIAEILLAERLRKLGTLAYGKSLLLLNSVSGTSAALVLVLSGRLDIAFLVSSVTIGWVILRKLGSTVSLGSRKQFSFPCSTKVAQRALLRATGPLGIALFIDSAITQTPRLFLAASFSEYELGILVGLLMFLSLGTLVGETMVQVATPAINRLIRDKAADRILRLTTHTTLGTIGVSAGLAAVVYSSGSSVVAWVLDESYRTYTGALALVVAVFALQFLMRIYFAFVTAARNTDWLAAIDIVTLGSSVLLGWLWIPGHGIDGAMFTVAGANAVKWLLSGVLLIVTIDRRVKPKTLASFVKP